MKYYRDDDIAIIIIIIYPVPTTVAEQFCKSADS